MAVDDCKGETQHVIEKGDSQSSNNLIEKDSRNEIEQLIVADTERSNDSIQKG